MHVNQPPAKKLPHVSGKKHRNRKTAMRESEMVTVMILFHLSHYRMFKDFYCDCILKRCHAEFPRAVSYPRFVALMPRCLETLTRYALSKTGKNTGMYYVDSTKMVVCHNRRIYRNKVFKRIAERGYCSVGFFYGFKLHIVINHQGEMMSFIEDCTGCQLKACWHDKADGILIRNWRCELRNPECFFWLPLTSLSKAALFGQSRA